MRRASISDFAKHPADRFLNQIMIIVKKDGRDPQRVFEFMVADIVEGTEHRDSAIPKNFRFRETIKSLFISRS